MFLTLSITCITWPATFPLFPAVTLQLVDPSHHRICRIARCWLLCVLTTHESMSVIPDLYDDPSLRRVLVAAGVVLLLVPAIQVGIQIWPLQLTNIQWRFAAANALSSSTLLPSFLGLALLLTIGRKVESKALQRTVGALAVLFTLGLGVSIALFVLDAIQLKAIVNTQMEASFRNIALRVSTVSGIFFLVNILLAWAAFRAPKSSVENTKSKGSSSKADHDSVGLLVGVDD